MGYEAVLFDNDGVLVEPIGRSVLRRATWEAFDALGVPDPDPDDVDRLAVGVTPDLLATVCEQYDLDPERFWRARDYHSSHAQRAALRDGRATLYDDFDAVRAIDAPRGIVSSNQQDTVEFMHDFFATRDLFETAYGRAPTVRSLDRKKPEPYYLRRALADLDVETALFVGDSESDVLAARAAGLDAAFVRRPHRESYDLSAEPTYELGGLTDLLDVEGVPTRGGA
ncbi:HAD family hydrolase [Haloplanus rallus]|jgi:HAD superfamily hydrolase (TIGR01549 family)|uniref:HAD family hydrolase n=1 Tax=Haloplanus rallus TaxID=1816183 RepID=A0A6B9FB97_9EURY|nr:MULTISPECIES: HAD-IA family hydrolase [Haloplanus]QGX96097.1 HAD family hydrolase [Haloplanus rallus]